MFPIYNNLDEQIKIMAIELFNNNKNGVAQMKKEIVERKAPEQFKLFNNLATDYKVIFSFAALNCDRVITINNLIELNEYLPAAPVFIKDNLKKSLSNYGFCYSKFKLSNIAPSQKILFILDKE